MDDESAIKLFIKEKRKFDIVFLDPPYKLGRYEEIVSLFIRNNLLKEHAIIVIESDRDVIISEEHYSRRRDYKYGEIKVAILWR